VGGLLGCAGGGGRGVGDGRREVEKDLGAWDLGVGGVGLLAL
jgi:hypothetical protein